MTRKVTLVHFPETMRKESSGKSMVKRETYKGDLHEFLRKNTTRVGMSKTGSAAMDKQQSSGG